MAVFRRDVTFSWRLAGDDGRVLEFAPRLPQRLLDEIERQSKRREPIAAINRRVGAAAWQMGFPRPSYQQVRVLVHEARRYRRYAPKSFATLQLEWAYHVRPPEVLLRELVAPHGPRLRDRAPPPK